MPETATPMMSAATARTGPRRSVTVNHSATVAATTATTTDATTIVVSYATGAGTRIAAMPV